MKKCTLLMSEVNILFKEMRNIEKETNNVLTNVYLEHVFFRSFDVNIPLSGAGFIMFSCYPNTIISLHKNVCFARKKYEP